jgi:hypothetical protein
MSYLEQIKIKLVSSGIRSAESYDWKGKGILAWLSKPLLLTETSADTKSTTQYTNKSLSHMAINVRKIR